MNDKINELIQEIDYYLSESRKEIQRIEQFTNKLERDNKDETTLSALLYHLPLFYTQAESLLLHLQKYFGNGIDTAHWHTSLLKNAVRERPAIRPAIISPESFNLLMELKNFRHFSRYNYDFNLISPTIVIEKGTIAIKLAKSITEDIQNFKDFLSALSGNASNKSYE